MESHVTEHVIMVCFACGVTTVHDTCEDDGRDGIMHVRCIRCGNEWRQEERHGKDDDRSGEH